MPLLVMEKIDKHFNKTQALTAINLTVNATEHLAICGPVKSGKTTLLNLISGLCSPTSGKIFFRGENLASRPLNQYASIGIARTFTFPRVFEELSVWENVLIGTHPRGSWNMIGAFHGFFAPCVKKEEQLLKDLAMDCLKKVELLSKTQCLAKKLSGFELKLLELARVMASQPLLLLLDEPSRGLNLHEQSFLKEVLQNLQQSGTTLILTEEDFDFARNLAARPMMLEGGSMIDKVF